MVGVHAPFLGNTITSIAVNAPYILISQNNEHILAAKFRKWLSENGFGPKMSVFCPFTQTNTMSFGNFSVFQFLTDNASFMYVTELLFFCNFCSMKTWMLDSNISLPLTI